MSLFESIQNYCLSKPFTEESMPFGGDVWVVKVHGKMFALCSIEHIPFQINLKCQPEYALELRANYHAVTPGWHMNKTHWNTVTFDPSEISLKFLFELIMAYQSLT